MNENYQYTLHHSFTKAENPKDNFAKDKEDFGFTVVGDSRKGVIKEMEDFKKNYPPLTHTEKIEIAVKKNLSTPPAPDATK